MWEAVICENYPKDRLQTTQFGLKANWKIVHVSNETPQSHNYWDPSVIYLEIMQNSWHPVLLSPSFQLPWKNGLGYLTFRKMKSKHLVAAAFLLLRKRVTLSLLHFLHIPNGSPRAKLRVLREFYFVEATFTTNPFLGWQCSILWR